MDRRIRQNCVVLFISLLIFLSVWQIITGPGPPVVFQIDAAGFAYRTAHYTNFTYPYPLRTLGDADYTQLIDLKNFTFTMLATPCNASYPFIIILVHSAPGNFQKRQTIRETWGSRNGEVKTLFMLGEVMDEGLRRRLEKENETYGDFVQGTFLDTYRNVTYKHAMVFKYVIYHCPNAKYLVKADDDVFVNVYSLSDYMKNALSPYGMPNILMCNLLTNAIAWRTYRSKWRVSFKEYPHKYYPPYCPGWALVYSQNVVFDLYKQLQNTTYFWIDDVLITGILFKQLNLTHFKSTYLTPSLTNHQRILDGDAGNDVPSFLFGLGELKEKDIREYWAYANGQPALKNYFANQNELTTDHRYDQIPR